MLDTEDKLAWCLKGLSMEKAFVEEIVPRLGLDLQMNPTKDRNKYAPDLVHGDGTLADLKTQNTPFFTARRYGVDPGRTVTFNRKDLVRYREKYPDITVYFYVRWDVLSGYGVDVPPLHGVWKATLQQIEKIIPIVPEHFYQRRENDMSGNAKNSYLIPLSALKKVATL